MNEIELLNFQSHKHSYLEFHPRLNIIRGTSHHGKSSIIRAIQWAITNTPLGAKFRNWHVSGKDGVEAHLSFDGGAVSRIHRTGFNGYIVREEDVSGGTAEEMEFEALRGDVPHEVRQVSFMDESNIWGQDDGYFLIKDTPGNVARKLNERAGLEDIDSVAKIAKGLISDYENKLTYANEGLDRAKDRREYLKGIEKHREAIEAIDDLFKEYDSVLRKQKDLEGRIETISEIQVAIDKRTKFLESKEDVEEITKLLDRRLKVSDKYTRLRLAINDINEIMNYMEVINNELQAEPIINELIVLFDKRLEEQKKAIAISNMWDKITVIEKDIHVKENEIDSFDIHINELMEAYEDIAECPTCGALRCHWGHEIIGD